ncbi:hypothetical protein L208DRAFT_1490561 [Tricholoma matsutake]|nr:hypothetical protein L208DRAFT_1490561 [Tricholoma matsutake 945]
MTDDPTASSSAPSRPKPTRSTTAGAVRGRSPSNAENGDGRPPTKRARKAINCEPCRNSKLKCDRNRPCSSCVLRGTSALCYQDGRGNEGNEVPSRGDDHHYSRIDPAQEITRIRHSVSVLESYIFPAPRPPTQRRQSDASNLVPKKELIDPDVTDKHHAPGILGNQGHGLSQGLYAGPTSTLHLLHQDSRRASEEEESDPLQNTDSTGDFPGITPEYDRDLLSLLPPIEIIDGLIDFYFEYCNWIYRHINQPAFTRNWERFKNGSSADRIILSTACAIMAAATCYLPPQHPLLASYSESHEEMGNKFYEVSKTALQRRLAETKVYTLELVELYLIKGTYQTLVKSDTEEVWQIRGELVTIGMAMGLHRDPGKWRMHRDVAERRRWAWWHIVLMERWQAFMLGRPLAFSSRHFDTQLPSYCDTAIDKTGRLFAPNVALFRLAYTLGDIMDDAVSVRPVPYESVQANDRALTQWMDSLPEELDLDEYRLARSLASPNTNVRRVGVQSVVVRASYYHIRFSLHRPYASSPSSGLPGGKQVDSAKAAQSLEIAVGAADKLITIVTQSRPDFLANSALAVPGHMSWGPFHAFSAAMFFSFHLIAHSDQPGAGLFRQCIRKATTLLEQARGNSVADKSYDILQALSPLYSTEFPIMNQEAREKQRQQVLSVVRKLAFPLHDSRDSRRNGESPSDRVSSSSSSVSPSLGMMNVVSPQQYDSLHNIPTVRVPFVLLHKLN